MKICSSMAKTSFLFSFFTVFTGCLPAPKILRSFRTLTRGPKCYRIVHTRTHSGFTVSFLFFSRSPSSSRSSACTAVKRRTLGAITTRTAILRATPRQRTKKRTRQPGTLSVSINATRYELQTIREIDESLRHRDRETSRATSRLIFVFGG